MANYAIMRMEKRKLGSVGRICNHHERLKAEFGQYLKSQQR